MFPLRGFGDNNTDVIREISVDESTHDVFFSDLNETFVLRSGNSTPEQVTDAGETFWLRDDAILYPGGVQQGTDVPVLLSKPRGGGEAKVIVKTPAPTSPGEWLTVDSVLLAGDDVIWREEKQRGTGTQQETTTSIRRTSWRTPAEPQLLYTTQLYVIDVIIAGGRLYLTEGKTFAKADEVQKIIDLKTGAVESQTTLDKFGGGVEGADDESVIVSRFHYEEPVSVGLFRLAHDGSGEVKLSDHALILQLASRSGTWAFTTSDGIGEPFWLLTYSAAAGVKKIGCADGDATTTHALALDQSAAYLSILRDQKAATILRYPL